MMDKIYITTYQCKKINIKRRVGVFNLLTLNIIKGLGSSNLNIIRDKN